MMKYGHAMLYIQRIKPVNPVRGWTHRLYCNLELYGVSDQRASSRGIAVVSWCVLIGVVS